jgi:hypothetical protein
VNPRHLEPVTQRENILRGQSFAAKNARKTKCLNGHVFDSLRQRGGRNCNTCRRVYNKNYRLKRRSK